MAPTQAGGGQRASSASAPAGARKGPVDCGICGQNKIPSSYVEERIRTYGTPVCHVCIKSGRAKPKV